MERAKYKHLGEAAWRGHIETQAHSGESVREYCEKNDLCASSFRRWRKELSPADEGAGFIRLELQEDGLGMGLIITTPNGYRVEATSIEVGIAAARSLAGC